MQLEGIDHIAMGVPIERTRDWMEASLDVIVRLLAGERVLKHVLIGFALSRGPETPRVAFVNQVPPGQPDTSSSLTWLVELKGLPSFGRSPPSEYSA